MSEAPLTRVGVPHALDTFVAAPIRALAHILGLATAGALLWAGWPWVAPLPWVALWLATEGFLALRARQVLTLHFGEHLSWRDGLTGRMGALDPAAVQAATLWAWKSGARVRIHLVCHAADGALALELDTRDEAYLPAVTDVPVNFLEPLFGVGGGSLLAVAPPGSALRQPVYDPDGVALAWFRQRIPLSAWETTSAALWQGAPPPINRRGFLEGPATHHLSLCGARVSLSDGEFLPLHAALARGERPITLRDPVSGEDTEAQWPHLCVSLPWPIWFPAPLVDLALPTCGPAEGYHTHHALGMAIVWHLLTRLPVEDWPETWPELAWEGRVHHALPAALSALERHFSNDSSST